MRQSIKGGRCKILSINKTTDKVFITILEKLNVNGKKSEVIEANVIYMARENKSIEKEYDSFFDVYRKTKEKEKEKYVKNKLSKVPVHTKLKNNLF